MQTSGAHAACRPGALDLVITVCGRAHERCPIHLPRTPGVRLFHHGFDDPPALAAQATSDEEAMSHYRRVRDEIRTFVETLPGMLAHLTAADRLETQ